MEPRKLAADDPDRLREGPKERRGVDSDRRLPSAPLANDAAPETPHFAAFQKPEWSSAVELVQEARAAMRDADERTATAERYSQQLDQHYKEKIKGLEARIAGAEKRSESADERTSEAEEWLLRFKSSIETNFADVLREK
jgi:hypothetical protein